MIIYVNEAGAVALSEPDDLKHFRVDAGGQPSSAVELAIRASGAGQVTGEYAFISEAWLRHVGAPLTNLPDWSEQLSGMVEYARTRGWVSGDGQLVRAHMENLK